MLPPSAPAKRIECTVKKGYVYIDQFGVGFHPGSTISVTEKEYDLNHWKFEVIQSGESNEQTKESRREEEKSKTKDLVRSEDVQSDKADDHEELHDEVEEEAAELLGLDEDE